VFLIIGRGTAIKMGSDISLTAHGCNNKKGLEEEEGWVLMEKWEGESMV
jgi:hypothetical protein